jgi:transcriptional regulator with XRE-family HTH domain
MTKFAIYIKKKRQEMGLTQREFAAMLDVNYETYVKVEEGKRNASDYVVLKYLLHAVGFEHSIMFTNANAILDEIERV